MSDRPDLQPGFWPNYRPPASNVAAAIQYPMDDRWANRVLNAVRQDSQATRRSKGDPQDE